MAIELGPRQTGRMLHLLGPRQRFLTPLLGLVRIAQHPESQREGDEGGDPGLIPSGEERERGLVGVGRGADFAPDGPGP